MFTKAPISYNFECMKYIPRLLEDIPKHNRFTKSKQYNPKRLGIILLFTFLALWETGCGEKIKKGAIYKDPLNRFEVIKPSNEMNVDRWGVSFSDPKNFFHYLVRTYDTPPLQLENQLTIANVLSDLKSMLDRPEFEIKILSEEPTTFKGLEAMTFNFSYTSRNEGWTNHYYSRLIRTENYVYWVYLMTVAGGEKTVIITNESEVINASSVANNFFNSINFLK